MSIQSIKAKFKQLTRKDYVIAGLVIVIIALFVQKANLQEEFERMESDYDWEMSQLQSKIDAKQTYIEAINSSVKEISSEVDNFEFEDWSDVVPNVYHSVKELERNIEEDPE